MTRSRKTLSLSILCSLIRRRWLRFEFLRRGIEMKWSPWRSTGAGGGGGAEKKKLVVKVSQLKLLGFQTRESVEDEREKLVAIEVKWKGPNKPVGGLLLAPFYRSRRDYTGRRDLIGGEYSVEWDDEFERLFYFSPNDVGSFGSWDLGFSLLYGGSGSWRGEWKSKMAVVGKVSLNLKELALGTLSMETQIERKLPMVFKIGGTIPSEAILSVCLTLMDESTSTSSDESLGRVHGPPSVSVTGRTRFMNSLTYLRSFEKPGEGKRAPGEAASQETNQLTLFHSRGSPGNSSVRSDVGSNNLDVITTDTEFESSMSSENQSNSGTRPGFSSFKRRRFGFQPNWGKEEEEGEEEEESVTECTCLFEYEVCPLCKSAYLSRLLKSKATKHCGELAYGRADYWKAAEIVSRSGQAKLKTDVYFASFDQRSHLVSGEGACSTLAVVIAHWLHSNEDFPFPTRLQFNSLIFQGSMEWQRLCRNKVYRRNFPDKHFDIETVLEANIRPLDISVEKSFIGFFSPEKFESLKDVLSFDDIWGEITNATLSEPRIFIVSWNDHFFVMKMEKDAYYIIDTYGERLFRGCARAYILKFDDSSVMYVKKADEEVGANSEEKWEVIRTGKECCKEFFNRFLAAMLVRELEEEDKNGNISTLTLYERLQIELHYTYLPPSSPSPSSPATSTTLSLFSSEEST